MLKDGNGVTRRSAAGTATYPGRNLTADAGKGRTLRSSARRHMERPRAEPVVAREEPYKGGATGSSKDLKRRIGCVKRTRRSKSRRIDLETGTGAHSKTGTEFETGVFETYNE